MRRSDLRYFVGTQRAVSAAVYVMLLAAKTLEPLAQRGEVTEKCKEIAHRVIPPRCISLCRCTPLG